MNSIHESLARQGYTRSSSERVIGGVCGGLATKWGINAWALRCLVVLLMFVLPGSPILLYPAAWIVMPDDTFTPNSGPITGSGPQDRLTH